MTNHFHFTDEEFANEFKNATLPPSLFSHEAHLRLAWIYVKAYGIEQAVDMVKSQLINYVNHLGAVSKYNETVTIAAVRAVYHFTLKSKSHNFKDFIDEFPRLKTNFKDILGQHYGIDLFNSKMAKSSFLEPDLLPFD
ncbi:hypothetical protein [Winogradskyella sp. 3972H.M.0a.05]|uniref:hypothetical protein n=1 Tax=Winogradskyella sp. 3972H.M.0a.05 TaxID=2950277 RepID=UPI003397E6A3